MEKFRNASCLGRRWRGGRQKGRGEESAVVVESVPEISGDETSVGWNHGASCDIRGARRGRAR